MSRNRDEKYIHKNKLETEPERKKKFGKEFAEIPKGKRYVEELEPLLGAVIVLECDDWGVYPRRAWRYAVREVTAEICEACQVSGKQRS